MIYYPLVSVLINNYNYDRFLTYAIESVLNQTYKNIELIIVDDGSTDDSKDIIDRYYQSHRDVIIPIYKENGGQASAFNAGFKASRGDIIAFLDSDDYWFSDKIEKIVKLHETHEVVQHNLLINGKEKYYEKLSNRHDSSVLLKKYGFYDILIPTTGFTFIRDTLIRVFPIPEEPLRICADTFVVLNALYFCDIYSTDDALGYYRVHGSNAFYNNFDKEKNQKKNETIKIELNRKLHNEGLREIPFDKYSYSEIMFLSSINIIDGDDYLLYGTGKASEKLTGLIEKAGGRVKYYSDSNPGKWGKSFLDKPIISPEEIQNKRAEVSKIIIASMYIDEICNKLKGLGFNAENDILIPSV